MSAEPWDAGHIVSIAVADTGMGTDAERKDRTHAGLAHRRDVAAHHARKLQGDRQSQAAAAEAP